MQSSFYRRKGRHRLEEPTCPCHPKDRGDCLRCSVVTGFKTAMAMTPGHVCESVDRQVKLREELMHS